MSIIIRALNPSSPRVLSEKSEDKNKAVLSKDTHKKKIGRLIRTRNDNKSPAVILVINRLAGRVNYNRMINAIRVPCFMRVRFSEKCPRVKMFAV